MVNTKNNCLSMCVKDSAYNVKDLRFDVDYDVSTSGGIARVVYNNRTATQTTNYPIPLALSPDENGSSYNSKLYLTAMADRNPLLNAADIDSVVDLDLLDEVSTFTLGDSTCMFQPGVIPVWPVSGAALDDDTKKTLFRITNHQAGIDLKIEATSISRDPNNVSTAATKFTEISHVYDLKQSKTECDKKVFKKLSFCTYRVHQLDVVVSATTTANFMFITFVKNCNGKFFAGLLHGKASNHVAGSIFPKSKLSGSYQPTVFEMFKIIAVPVPPKKVMLPHDLKAKIIEKVVADTKALQGSFYSNGTIGNLGLEVGVSTAVGPVNPAVTTGIDAENFTAASKNVAFGSAGSLLEAMLVKFIAKFNTNLAASP